LSGIEEKVGTMGTEQSPRDTRRRTLAVSCTCRGVANGFTNLVVSKRGAVIELDPHVTGLCVLMFDEVAATALRDVLTEWLG
jgi:hypothetical protein